MKNPVCMKPFAVVACLLLAELSKTSSAFTPPIAATTVAPTKGNAPQATVSPQPLQPKDVVTKVAVAGATGRTGTLVVEELLSRGVKEVVALVRDEKTSQEAFANPADNLQITKCDLNNEREMKKGTAFYGLSVVYTVFFLLFSFRLNIDFDD